MLQHQCPLCHLELLTSGALRDHMQLHSQAQQAVNRRHWRDPDYHEYMQQYQQQQQQVRKQFPSLASSFVPAVPGAERTLSSIAARYSASAGAPPAVAAAAAASGTSASTAIELDDDEAPAVTMASVVASQRLSLAEAKAFVARTFLADEFVHSMKLPLVDPLTLMRIVVPVRSRRCEHVRCMDLATILEQAAHSASRLKPLNCPICHLVIQLADLVVDEFLQARLKEGQTAGRWQADSTMLHDLSWLAHSC